MRSTSRDRLRGNFLAKSYRRIGMTGQKTRIRSPAAGVYSSSARFSNASVFNFGVPKSNFGKNHEKSFQENLNNAMENYGVFEHEIDLTKPWVTEDIKNEEIKKQELLQAWKNTKSNNDWSNFIIQQQSVHFVYEKAKADYATKNSNEIRIRNNISNIRRYYCETCDKSFRDNNNFLLHMAEHETCGRDGCDFTAHPKIIAKHIKMQHATGLYKRIKKLYTEEDIAKWIEERKKRYPTRKVIEEKKILEQEKFNRGERIKDNNSKFNKSFQNKNKSGRKKIEKKNSYTARNQHRKKMKKTFVVRMCVEEESSACRKGIPAFLGIKSDNNLEMPNENHLDISDEEWENEQSVTKPLLNNSLGLLATLYDSDEENQNENLNKETKIENMSADEESAPDEVKTVSHKNSLPKEEPNISPQKLLIAKKEHPRKRKKKPFNDCNMEKKETRVISLLEKLLKNEIRHERNVILQCVHYIVKNNFFRT